MIEKPAIGDPCNGCGLCCRAQVCSIGSFTLRLVEKYGERAPGPCPAMLTDDNGKVTCELVARPRDYSPGKGGAHELRNAVSLLIGSGIGCDEAGDEPDANAKLDALREKWMREHSRGEIARALSLWFNA